VIVVDDGVATGATMEAAIRAARRKCPRRLIAATAVAPPSVVDRLQLVADEVVCLMTPAYFFAVGGFFDDFSEVTDEEAARALQPSAASAHASSRAPATGDQTR
jgi:putative phosphoribosyl transferase